MKEKNERKPEPPWKKTQRKKLKTDEVVMLSIWMGVLGFILLMVIVKCFIPIFLNGWGKEYKYLFYTEENGKNMAAKALKEKYGEEFRIHDVWSKASHEYYVLCSPMRNREVLFEAVMWKNGEIEYDEYVQGVVARQISDKLMREIQDYFGGCYVHTTALREKSITYETIADVSIVPDLAIYIYGVDEETMEWAKQYFHEHAQVKSEYSERELDWYEIVLRYEDNVLNMKYEDYKLQREEMTANGGEVFFGARIEG